MNDRIDIDWKPTREEVFAATVETRADRPVLVPADSGAWLATLGKLAGQSVVVKIERLKRHSDEQRGYYRGVVLVDVLSGLRAMAVEACEECQIKSTDHLHDFFKALNLPKILGPTLISLPGTEVRVEMMPNTTTILTQSQYNTYLELINKFAADLGIPVRAPGEEVYA